MKQRLVILNPTSRNGKSERVFEKLYPDLKARLGKMEVYHTTGPLDATARVRSALKNKEAGQILVAGGDGTVNECVNGYFEDGKVLSDKVPLGVINIGTGGDFYKTIRDLSGLYDVSVKENQFRMVDCGRVVAGDYTHYFANIASIGVSGSAIESLKTSSFQWGSPAYLYHSLKGLALYKPVRVKIRFKDTDGEWREVTEQLVNFFVCNARFSGGGMAWAPRAILDDGAFDLVLIGGVSKVKMVTDSSKVYAGRISDFPGVREYRASEVVVTSAHPFSGEIDGELFKPDHVNGVCEARYEVLPGKLPLIL